MSNITYPKYYKPGCKNWDTQCHTFGECVCGLDFEAFYMLTECQTMLAKLDPRFEDEADLIKLIQAQMESLKLLRQKGIKKK